MSYGTGADGVVVFDGVNPVLIGGVVVTPNGTGVYSMPKGNVNATLAVVLATATVEPNNNEWFATQAIICNPGSQVIGAGGAGNQTGGGGTPPSGTLAGGTTGIGGGNAPGGFWARPSSPGTLGISGAGGNGGLGGDGGCTGVGHGGYITAPTAPVTTLVGLRGGAGGGSGSCSVSADAGGSGGGASQWALHAPTVTLNCSLINFSGGRGADGQNNGPYTDNRQIPNVTASNAGAGGGGGGGAVLIETDIGGYSGSAVINVSGGLGGNGFGTGGNGQPGSPGAVVYLTNTPA